MRYAYAVLSAGIFGIIIFFAHTATQPRIHDFFQLQRATIQGIPFTFVRVPSQAVTMRVAVTSSTVAAVTTAAPAVVVNGGYFAGIDFIPAGFVASGGKKISERLFDKDKSGGLFYNGAITIEDAVQNNFLQAPESIQSYPILIRAGKSAVEKDSSHIARRTAIALDAAGNVVIIIADEKEISLYEFSQALAEFQPHIVTAINLDGGASTGIAVHGTNGTESIDSYTPVANVVIFEKK